MVAPAVNVAGIARIEMRILGRYMAPSVAELMVDSFNGYDPARQSIIYNDGDVSNLNLGNLRPATRDDYAQHVTETLRAVPEEDFRPVRHVSDIDMTHYLVSNTGRVYSTRTRTFLSWYEGAQSYASVILYHNTLSIYFAMHCLVWSAFHDRPTGPGLVIDHLDMDRQNNNINNLEEVTAAENTRRAVEARRVWLETLTTAELREMEEEQQEERRGERWLPARIFHGDTRFPLPALGYEVSDHGRVRNTRTGRILRNAAGYNGYYFVRINGRSFRVNRLVASTFIANNDPQHLIYVDHIDGVRTNNSVTNLRWVTPQQNTSFAHAVRMRAYRADLSQEHVFNAINEARNFRFNDRRFPITTIKDYMRRGVPLHGWFFVREADAATQRAQEIQELQDDQALLEAEGEDNDQVQELQEEVDPLLNVEQIL